MNNKRKGIAHVLTLAVLATLLVAPATSSTTAAPHDADCPYCKLKVVQNTDTADNEVTLKFGNKRIEYRCVWCVVKDQKKYTGDFVVYAPSEKKNEPIIIKRTGGKWTASEGVVFLNMFKKHADCASLSRAFTNKAAFDKHVSAAGIKDAKALTLDQFIAAVNNPGE